MFTHLHVHSNFSLRDGAAPLDELVVKAREFCMPTLAVTDHHGLYGAIRFYQAARAAGIKPIIGAELRVESGDEDEAYDGYHLVLLAKDAEGYAALCRLITEAHLSMPTERRFKSPADDPVCSWESLRRVCGTADEGGGGGRNRDGSGGGDGHLFALSGCRRGEVPAKLLKGEVRAARYAARRLTEAFGRDNFLIELIHDLAPDSSGLIYRLDRLAREMNLRTVATNNVHYLEEDDFRLHDIAAGVRQIKTLEEITPRLNGELYFKDARRMRRLFRNYRRALTNTGWVAARCNLELDLETFKFPRWPVPPGETPYSYLARLSLDSARFRYRPLGPQVLDRINHELAVIQETGFAEYFLLVWDIVRWARSRGIRCAGRGSAADSIICYLLDITIADPIANNLLFERFLNPNRRDMPDIDVDFDSRRRDEVIDYVYQTYGKDKVAMVATVSTYRARGAVRDVAKVLGYSRDEIDMVAKPLPYMRPSKLRQAIEELPELKGHYFDPDDLEPLLSICAGIDGFPRHLGVHLGGLIVSPTPLTQLMPLERAAKGVIISQFDKDDIEALKLVKMDILGLRMLSAIEEACEMLTRRGVEIDIDSLPLDDPNVYRLLRSTKTVGLFQLESPGMRELLGRLQPTRFSDIVANISLFRPGPMQADMITPYIARRHGEEPVTYFHPDLEPVLKETFGVIIYQEQVIEVAARLAGFSFGQADSLRRAMTHDRSPEEMAAIEEEFVAGCLARGVDEKTARLVFSKLAAFAAYGFNKAHAAGFGVIAYQTAYLKTYYPAELLAAILNNMPMGFYPARVIVDEARRLGIEVRPPDVNASEERWTVEYDRVEPQVGRADSRSLHAFSHQRRKIAGESVRSNDFRSQRARPSPLRAARLPAIRTGLMQVSSLSKAAIRSIVEARRSGPYHSLDDFLVRVDRSKVTRPMVDRLTAVGVFESLGVPGVGGAAGEEDPVAKLQVELEVMGLNVSIHPLELYRTITRAYRVTPSSRLTKLYNGQDVAVAGLIVSTQTPPTRSGQRIIFSTIEDEDGLIDITLFPRCQDKCAHVIYSARAVLVKGRLRKTGVNGIGIIVEDMEDLEKLGARDARQVRPDPQDSEHIETGEWTKPEHVPAGPRTLAKMYHRGL